MRRRFLVALALSGSARAQLTVSQNGGRLGDSRLAPFAFYDPVRGRVTVVGGVGSPPGVVQWEGIDSVQLTGLTPFPTRSHGAVATDAQGVTLLFGGLNADGSLSGESWRFDPSGPTLTQITGLATAPSARSHTAMALHRGTGDLVLFGGRDAGGERADTWVWRNGAWLQLSPATSPPARQAHAMAFDPGSNSVLLYGGRSNGAALGDVWRFDGSAWTGLLSTGPSNRYGHAMALDATRNEILMVGGDLSLTQTVGDAWVWRNGGWQPSAGGPASAHGALVHDPRRQRMVHTGGDQFVPFFNFRQANRDTNTWDGSAWQAIGGYGGVASGPDPEDRYSVGAAYCSTRGRIVMFGGRSAANNAVLQETWEFGDGFWGRRSPALSPSARHLCAMVSTGPLVFLFGGENGLGQVASNDMWRYDGVNWSITPSTTRPPARSQAAMAYDPVRQRILLYGGIDQAANPLGDAWEYEVASAQWQVAMGTPPPARVAPALAYNPARGRIQMQGGQRPGAVLSPETWEYDGSTWTLLGSSGPQVQEATMAFDAVRNRMVLSGGYVRSGTSLVMSDYTFELNGTAWGPAIIGASYMAQLMFLPERQACVSIWLLTAQVSEWNGSAWTASPASRLGTRVAHSATFDPVRRVAVSLGGQESTTVFGDWWDWDGRNWTRNLARRALPPRHSHDACWSPLDGMVVLFGGRAPNNTPLGDTWLLDAAGADWVPVPGAAPAARYGHTLCVEESTGRVILFGGVAAASPSNETWRWNRSPGWTQVTGFINPPARSGHAMAWHAPTGRLVLFGGSGAGGFMNDTWHYTSAAGWSVVNPAHVPPVRTGATLVADPTRGRLVLHGGLGSGLVTLGDLWEWDGSDWTQRTPETAVPALFNHAGYFDSVRRRVVLSAGSQLHHIWENISPAGTGDLAAPLPLTWRSQAVVGDPLLLTLPLPSGLGLLFYDGGPATAPRFVLPPPTGCGNQRMFLSGALYFVTTTPDLRIGIPADPSLLNATLVLQALVLQGNCLRATDALHAVLLPR